MAIIEDRVIGAIGFFDLVQRLRYQKTLQAVAGHEGKRRLEEVQPSQRGKLVEHQQQPVSTALEMKILGQSPPDLVQDQSHQRLGSADVRRRHHEIERRWPLVFDEIADAPVAASRDLCDNRIAIKTEERHGGGEHAGAFVLAFV